MGGEKSFKDAEGGGGTKRFEVVFMRYLEVLAILKGGRKKFYPALRGGLP